MESYDINLKDNNKNLIILTTGGKFNLNMIASISLLTNYYEKIGYNIIIKTNGYKEEIKKPDIIIDIKDKNSNIIWKEYGKNILKLFLNSENIYNYIQKKLREINLDQYIDELYDKIYIELIQYINIDNDIYNISNLNFISIIYSMNNNLSEDKENFNNALNLCNYVFDIKFTDIVKNYIDFKQELLYIKNLLTENIENKIYLIVNDEIKNIYKCLDTLNCNDIKYIIFYNKDNFVVECRSNNNKLLNENILKSLLNEPDELYFINKELTKAETSTLETAIEIIELSINYKKKENKIFLSPFSITGLSSLINIYYNK